MPPRNLLLSIALGTLATPRRVRLPQGQRERAAARPGLLHELGGACHPRVRKECTELAWGECEVMDVGVPPVLALAYRFRKAAMLTLHNFSDAAQTIRLKLSDPGGERLVDLLGAEHSKAAGRGTHEIALDGYGYRWFRVGTVDETLTRAPY